MFFIMVYVKEKLADGIEIRIDINDENLFTMCPECGKELPVGDLTDYTKEELATALDLGTVTYCSKECYNEAIRKNPHLKPTEIITLQ